MDKEQPKFRIFVNFIQVNLSVFFIFTTLQIKDKKKCTAVIFFLMNRALKLTDVTWFTIKDTRSVTATKFLQTVFMNSHDLSFAHA